MFYIKKFIYITLCYLMLVQLSFANIPDINGKPIEILSDSLEILKLKDRAIFENNVKIIQGEMTLLADKVEVIFNSSANDERAVMQKLKKISAFGNVNFTTQKENIIGDKVVYNLLDEKVEILGNVKINRDDNVVLTQKLEYNIKTGETKLGASSNSRVKGVFVPNSGDN